MSAQDPLKPYPDYEYSEASAKRADGVQEAARRATLKLADGPLFDTEPALIAKTLARLGGEDGA